MNKIINTGKWTVEELDSLLHDASAIKDAGARIEFISGMFLVVPYSGSTLIGNYTTEEVLVVNLEKVDCFTFIDYVEAMRRSVSFAEFIENLMTVRYHSEGSSAENNPIPTHRLLLRGQALTLPLKGRECTVSFKNRNHFFTDWIEYNSGFVDDVTDSVGEHRVIQVIKKLNLKKDGTCFIEGIKSVDRKINYIPPSAIDRAVMERLKTGDYAGVYYDEAGLDVSHVGIIIRAGDKIYIRHASSRPNIRKVIDEDFIGYIAQKPGLVVLRPKEISSQAGGL